MSNEVDAINAMCSQCENIMDGLMPMTKREECIFFASAGIQLAAITTTIVEGIEEVMKMLLQKIDESKAGALAERTPAEQELAKGCMKLAANIQETMEAKK